MASKQPLTYYAQTMPGVEEIAWLEIRSHLPQAVFVETLYAKNQNGMVLFQHDGAAAALNSLRTAEDVFVLALTWDKVTRDYGDLRRIADMVSETAVFGRAVEIALGQRSRSRRPTVRVISRKVGQHRYRRKDLEGAVAKGLSRRYPDWQQVADNAHLEVWANLLGSRLVCGVRLSDRTMRHRHKKVVELEAALRPSVAAALVFLSQPAATDAFLDPFSGSGTILMERRFFGPYRHLLAADIAGERAVATRRNVIAQRKAPPPAFTVLQADAQKLPVAAQSIDKIATNLPFGKQIGSPRQVARLYPALFREMERVLAPGGRAVVLSSEFDRVKEAVRRCPGLAILTGYSIAVLGQWGRIYIIERAGGMEAAAPDPASAAVA